MILITRPNNKAKLTALKLKKKKIQCHIDSVISYRNRTKRFLLNNYSDIIIASSQSVDALKKRKIKLNDFENKNFYIIGNEVAKELRKNYNIKVKKIFRDSEDLTGYLKNIKIKKSNFCYFSGNVENKKFIQRINRLKIKYNREILYSVVRKKKFNCSTLELFKQNKINLILLYSSYTAETFLSLLESSKLKNNLQKIVYLCLSKKIASKMKKEGFRFVFHSEEPNENSLLKKLYEVI
tara:strand:+ start:161 stop:874 length:714 start_codon:yes stop_codon:yes gene_type:complete